MKFKDIVPFLTNNHRSIISTKRANGATHSSAVVSGAYNGHAAFVSVYPRSQKVTHLRQNSNCTVLTIDEDWYTYVVVEGQAFLLDFDNTKHSEMRKLLRKVYMACSDTPHPNWTEYDEAMVKQKAVIVLVRPDKVYGLLR